MKNISHYTAFGDIVHIYKTWKGTYTGNLIVYG